MKKHPKNIKKKTLDSKKLPVLLQLSRTFNLTIKGEKVRGGLQISFLGVAVNALSVFLVI